MKKSLLTLFLVICFTAVLAKGNDTLYLYYAPQELSLDAENWNRFLSKVPAAKDSSIRQITLYAYPAEKLVSNKQKRVAELRSFALDRYLVDSGKVNPKRVGVVLTELSEYADDPNAQNLANTIMMVIERKGGTGSYRVPQLFNNAGAYAAQHQNDANTTANSNDASTGDAEANKESETKSKSKKSKKVEPKIVIPYWQSPVFKTLARKAQSFKEENAKYEITLTTTSGTIITIPKQSLVDFDGNVIKDKVEIQVRELYKRSDFIQNNLSNVYDKTVMEATGAVQVTVIYKDDVLRLAPGRAISVEFVQKNKKIPTRGMKGYILDTLEGHLNWVLPELPPKEVKATLGGYKKAFEEQEANEGWNLVESNKLGWVSCQRTIAQDPTTVLTISADTTLGASLCAVVKGSNSVIPFAYYHGKYTANVPMGTIVTVVGLAEKGADKGKEQFLSIKEIKVTAENPSEVITFAKTTATAIRTELTKLDRY